MEHRLRKKFPDEALIKEKLLGRRVTCGGGSLRLVLPKDEGVLHPHQTAQGLAHPRRGGQ